MANDPITQMAADPDFEKLTLAQQRSALSAHDSAFGSLSDDQLTGFLKAYQVAPATPALSEGQLQLRKDLGLPPTATQEEVRNAYMGVSGKFMGTAAGAMIGGAAPTIASRILAAGVGTGAGALAGGATPGEAAITGLTGAVAQPLSEVIGSALSSVGKKLLAPLADKAADWWSSVTGYTRALEEAKNANLTRYLAGEQKAAAATAEGQANVAAVKAAQPQGPLGAWSDLNQSIGATPAKSIRIAKGSADVENAYGIPGRGLEAEGFTKEALQKMNPTEQAAVIGPRFQAAGKAVQATADKATEQGITLDAGKSVTGVIRDRIKDPKLQEKAIEIINSHQQELGIDNIRKATPTQALALRQALRNEANFGPNATTDSLKGVGRAIYSAVSRDLHEAVPGMQAVDVHYGDLAQAVDAVRGQIGKYVAGKWTPPKTAVQKAEAAVPELPTSSPYTPLPTSGSYTQQALRKLGIVSGTLGGLVGGGYAARRLLTTQP